MSISDRLSEFSELLKRVADARSRLRDIGVNLEDEAVLALLRELEPSAHRQAPQEAAERGTEGVTPGTTSTSFKTSPVAADQHLAEAVGRAETWYDRILWVLFFADQALRPRDIAETLMPLLTPSLRRDLDINRLRSRIASELRRVLAQQRERHGQGGPAAEIQIRRKRWSLTPAAREKTREALERATPR